MLSKNKIFALYRR